jgi:GTPase-associated protein 1, N-terminal domain type 2/GTPase-associated protein 1, middle domain
LTGRGREQVGQLWYTWNWRGIDRRSGFGVRAISEDLADGRIPADLLETFDFLEDDLPRDPAARTPVCLATYVVGGVRCLVRKSYLGVDGYERPGNYFVHALIGLPSWWTARDSIRMWASPVWVLDADGLPAGEFTLPPLVAGPLLASGTWRPRPGPGLAAGVAHLVERVMGGRPAVLTAPSAVAAAMVGAVTEILPPALAGGLTFSTYEARPGRGRVQVAAHWPVGGTPPAGRAARQRLSGEADRRGNPGAGSGGAAPAGAADPGVRAFAVAAATAWSRCELAAWWADLGIPAGAPTGLDEILRRFRRGT